jgi:hypothetical protein
MIHEMYRVITATCVVSEHSASTSAACYLGEQLLSAVLLTYVMTVHTTAIAVCIGRERWLYHQSDETIRRISRLE